MGLLPLIFEGELVLAALSLILIVLLISILKSLKHIGRLLKKLVVSVAVVTVKTDAASYEHTNPVSITGDVSLDSQPQANTPVSLVIKDISGAEFDLPDATTDAAGKFSSAWTIPPEVQPGVCTLSATALGMTVTATFTFSNLPKICDDGSNFSCLVECQHLCSHLC